MGHKIISVSADDKEDNFCSNDSLSLCRETPSCCMSRLAVTSTRRARHVYTGGVAWANHIPCVTNRYCFDRPLKYLNKFSYLTFGCMLLELSFVAAGPGTQSSSDPSDCSNDIGRCSGSPVVSAVVLRWPTNHTVITFHARQQTVVLARSNLRPATKPVHAAPTWRCQWTA